MIHLTRGLIRRWLDALLHIDDTPERTAALVTPDQTMARRVSAAMSSSTIRPVRKATSAVPSAARRCVSAAW